MQGVQYEWYMERRGFRFGIKKPPSRGFAFIPLPPFVYLGFFAHPREHGQVTE